MNTNFEKILPELLECIKDATSMSSFILNLKRFLDKNIDWLENSRNVPKIIIYVVRHDIEDFCIEEKSFDVKELYQYLSRFEFETLDHLLGKIAGLLWDILACSSSKKCPECGGSILQYVKEIDSEESVKPYLYCNECNYLDKDSYSIDELDKLVPSKIKN